MMRVLTTLMLVFLIGCLSTDQKFYERIDRTEYSEPDENGDQYVIAEERTEVRMKDGVSVPPWKSEAEIQHDLVYETTETGWYLGMGSADELKGGDISAALSELKGILGEARRIIELLHPATAGTSGLRSLLLEPLEEP